MTALISSLVRTSDPIWCLVHALEIHHETPKALLIQQFKDPNLKWIPKSQINFEVWSLTTCFIPVAKWLVGKKDLAYFAEFRGQLSSPNWLAAQEDLYRYQVSKEAFGEKKERMLWDLMETIVRPTPGKALGAERKVILAPPKRARAMNLHLDKE